jgi:hypothetical protein
LIAIGEATLGRESEAAIDEALSAQVDAAEPAPPHLPNPERRRSTLTWSDPGAREASPGKSPLGKHHK